MNLQVENHRMTWEDSFHSDMKFQYIKWVSTNNEAVSNITIYPLSGIISELHTLPPSAMLPQLELSVCLNHCIPTWDNLSTEMTTLALTTIHRVISRSKPSIPSLSPNLTCTITSLVSSLLQPAVLTSISQLQLVLDLLSLLFFNMKNKLDVSVMKQYFQFYSLATNYLIENKLDTQSHTKILILNLVHPANKPSSGGGGSITTSQVITTLLRVLTGTIDLTAPEHLDQSLLAPLITCAVHYKSGDMNKLADSLNYLLSDDQPQEVNVRGLVLKGDLLVQEKSFELALTFYSRAIQLEPSCVSAYLGIANCFPHQNKKQLEVCRIIQNILKARELSSATESVVSFLARCVDILIPTKKLTMVNILSTLGRKYFALGDYNESSSCYIDCLSLHRTGDDVTILRLETALSLMLCGRDEDYEDCKIVIKSLDNQTGGKRKRELDNHEIWRNFMLGRCAYKTGELQLALSHYDQCIQVCQIILVNKSKVVIGEKVQFNDGQTNRSELIQRLQARVYLEKSSVYHDLGDENSAGQSRRRSQSMWCRGDTDSSIDMEMLPLGIRYMIEIPG